LSLGRLEDARRKADRAVETSSSQLGFAGYAMHLIGDIATHPDQSDPKSGETYYRQALAMAEPRSMKSLSAHQGGRAGAGVPQHCDENVPRNGHEVLARTGGSRAGSVALGR